MWCDVFCPSITAFSVRSRKPGVFRVPMLSFARPLTVLSVPFLSGVSMSSASVHVMSASHGMP